jgi:hypothetical protein
MEQGMETFDFSNTELIKQLEQLYGFTDNVYAGGYIIPDGRMLYTLPSTKGHRCHHSIECICKRENFIASGAIRHVAGHNHFEIRKEPTDAQYEKLVEIFKEIGGEIVTDLKFGEDSLKATKYQIGTHPIMIIKDIRQFYFNLTEN